MPGCPEIPELASAALVATGAMSRPDHPAGYIRAVLRPAAGDVRSAVQAETPLALRDGIIRWIRRNENKDSSEGTTRPSA